MDLSFPEKVDMESALEVSHYVSNGSQAVISVELLGQKRVRIVFDGLMLPGVDTLKVSGVRAFSGSFFLDADRLILGSDDQHPPRILSSRLDAVSGVDNDVLTIVFEEDMLPADVTAMQNYALQYPSGTPFPLDSEDVEYHVETRTLTVALHGPGGSAFDLVVDTAWSLSITGLRDLSGNLMAQGTNPYGTVGGDQQAPTILSVTQNSLAAPGGTVVDLLADESLDPASVGSPSNYVFSNGAVAVSMLWIAETEILRLTLDAPVEAGVDTLSVQGLADTAGNSMDGALVLPVGTNDGVPPQFTMITGTTEPGFFNDVLVLQFDERLHPGDAVDPDLFTVESPIGFPLDLSGAVLSYDPDLWQTTIRFGGDFQWQADTGTTPRQLGLVGGESAGDRFGSAADGIGDVDGDGFPDFLIGAPHHDPDGMNYAGAVYVYSGRTNSLIRRLDGESGDHRFGTSVAALADINSDGIDDILVGAPQVDTAGGTKAGRLYVYSGADGSLLQQVDGTGQNMKLGENAATAGDIDGDGITDLLVGIPKENFGGAPDSGLVQVYSGADGQLIREWGGSADGDHLGHAVAGGFDLDQDGFDDVFFSADRADPGGLNDAGSAYVRSGKTGALLQQFDGLASGDHFGESLAIGGDVDGDQVMDFVVGAHHADPAGLDHAGSVFVFSGSDASLLYRIDGTAAKDDVGKAVDGGHDFDGDGVPDFVIGASGMGGSNGYDDGAVLVHSGADGSLLRTYLNEGDGKSFGKAVAFAGDLDRDQHADLLVSGEKADFNAHSESGQVRLEASVATFPYSYAAAGTELKSGESLRVISSDVRDLAGNQMPSPLINDTNLSGDFQFPLGVDITQNLWVDPSGTTVDLRFAEPLDLIGSPGFQASTSTGANLMESHLIDQGTVLRLRFDSILVPGSTSVTVQHLKDPAGNQLSTWTAGVVADPGTPQAIASSDFGLRENGTLVHLSVTFQQPVLEVDAILSSLWSLEVSGGDPIDISAADYRYDALSMTLSIEFPAVAVTTAGTLLDLEVSGLRDTHGNWVAQLQSSAALTTD
ncbi:MAG: hypothetical protein ACYTEP_04335 [Planctomycetota bacterium]